MSTRQQQRWFNTGASLDFIRKTGLAVVGVSVFLCIHVRAVSTDASSPAGYMTWSFPATTATSTTTTYLNIPLSDDISFASTVVAGGVTSTTLTIAGAMWANGQLATVATPCFVRITSGLQEGRIAFITANTSNTITVDVSDNSVLNTAFDAPGFAVAPGDRVEVFQGDTLASLFGDGSAQNPLPSNWVGAAMPFQADTISVFNPVTNRFDGYYFNTTRSAWNQSGSSMTFNNALLRPGSCLCVYRRSNRQAVTIILFGHAPVVSPLIKSTGSNSVQYSSTRFPTDMKLSELNLSNWTTGTQSTADTISIYNSLTQRWDGYYQLTTGQWRSNSNATVDRSNVIIPAGAAVAILRHGVVANQTSYIEVSMPYSAN